MITSHADLPGRSMKIAADVVDVKPTQGLEPCLLELE